jgi:predicted esterase
VHTRNCAVTLLLSVCWFGLANAANAQTASACAIEGERVDEVRIARLTLHGVPAIVRMPKVIRKPLVVLWHGFGPPASEADLMAALPLDDVPAIKVYLGLPLFGARTPNREEDSLARRQAQDYATRLFEPIVIGGARELPGVVQALVDAKCLGPNQSIGLLGFSAGGAAALVALTEREVPVRAAVTLNAPIGLNAAIDALERATKTPYSWTPETRRLAERTDFVRRAADLASRMPPPALLLFHGSDDTTVTPAGSVSLERALRPLYHSMGADQRLRLELAEHVSHDWTDPSVRKQVETAVADWFNENL